MKCIKKTIHLICKFLATVIDLLMIELVIDH